MPKSKKKKNSDFQKVKLKVGKERRSGNETNLSFKTRTIKVPQAFKDSASSGTQELHTKKKLTLDELLKRCDSNKTCSQRLSAVEGLRELMLGSGDSAVPSSSFDTSCCSVMTRVATLFSDPEPVVRRAVLRLFTTLLPLVGGQNVYLDYFGAQLRCALSHVSDEIRRDALLLFDLVLEKWPEQFITPSCHLVPALINQISTYMVTNKEARRTLVINPNSRLSSQKWRAEVLLRLTKVVEVFVKEHRKETAPPGEEESEVYRFGIDYPVVRLPCTPPRWKRLWTQWPKPRWCQQAQEYGAIARDAGQLQKFICTVFPVIQDCWREEYTSGDGRGPSHSLDSSDRPLSQDSLPVVQAVVGLLFSFVECYRCVYTHGDPNGRTERCQWFLSDFLGQLRELLLPQFPITLTERLAKVKKGQASQGQKGRQASPASADDSSAALSPFQVSVLKLNLTVCEILASFPPKEGGWPQRWVDPEGWQGEVVSFLLKNLKQSVRAGLIDSVVKVLRQVFFNFPYTENIGRLLARTQKRFVNAHPLSAEKKHLLELLDQLAFDLCDNSPYGAGMDHVAGSHVRHDLLVSYLQALPGLMLELCGLDNADVEQMAIHASKAMCSCRSPILLSAVRHHMPQLLDDQTGVFAKLPSSCHEHLYLAQMWAYHNTVYPEPILEQLELVIRLPRVDKKIARKLFSSVAGMYGSELMRKVRRGLLPIQEVETSRKPYLRFLFSVFVGHKKAELEAMNRDSIPQPGGLTHVVWNCSMEQFEKHQDVVQDGLTQFCHFIRSPDSGKTPGEDFVIDTLSEIWDVQILRQYTSLSALTVWSALFHWEFMLSSLGIDNSLQGDNGGVERPVNLTPEQWRCHVDQSLSVVKARQRPFMRLAFSLLYSMVALETGPEGGAVPPEGLTEEMWKMVVKVSQRSLHVLLELIGVLTQFVQDEKNDQEAMRTTLVMTKLLAAPELQSLGILYRQPLSQQLASFVAAVRNASPQAETRQWWQDFLNTCGLLVEESQGCKQHDVAPPAAAAEQTRLSCP